MINDGSRKLNPDFVVWLMRNDAHARRTGASGLRQRPAGHSGRVTRFVPGTPGYEALRTERFKEKSRDQ